MNVPRLLLLVLFATNFLLACGEQKTEQKDVTKGVSQKASYGGKITYSRSGKANSLDPALTNNTESSVISGNIYDTMVGLKPGATDIIPSLAESWKVSPDGKKYSFIMRKNVVFQDGTKCDAHAVEFSVERLINSKHPFYGVGGTFEYGSNLGIDQILASVKATSDSTVEFNLTEAYAPFLSILALPHLGIISPTALKKHKGDYFRNPVGTGPFQLADWQDDGTVLLVAFKDHWSGRPYLDSLVFKPIADNKGRVDALLSGAVDVIEGPNLSDMNALSANKSIKTLKYPGVNIGYMAMNLDHKPFQNIKVRQAINHAIDREAIVKDVFGSFGRVAKNPIPPMLLGYNNQIKPIQQDLEKAKALLDEAGFPNGFKTRIWAMPIAREYMPDGQKVAEHIKVDLAKIGVEAEIVTYGKTEWEKYLDDVGKGQHDMALFGWISDIPDPDNFLFTMLDKSVADNRPSMNIAFYRGEEIHKLLVQAREMDDQVKRADIYKQVCSIFNQELPWVTLAHSQVVVPMRSHVMNLNAYATYERKFQKVWVER